MLVLPLIVLEGTGLAMVQVDVMALLFDPAPLLGGDMNNQRVQFHRWNA